MAEAEYSTCDLLLRGTAKRKIHRKINGKPGWAGRGAAAGMVLSAEEIRSFKELGYLVRRKQITQGDCDGALDHLWVRAGSSTRCCCCCTS